MSRVHLAVIYGRALADEDGLADEENRLLMAGLDRLVLAGQRGVGRCWRDAARPAHTYWIGHPMARLGALAPKTQLDKLPTPSSEIRRDTHQDTWAVACLLPGNLQAVLLRLPLGIWLIPDFTP